MPKINDTARGARIIKAIVATWPKQPDGELVAAWQAMLEIPGTGMLAIPACHCQSCGQPREDDTPRGAVLFSDHGHVCRVDLLMVAAGWPWEPHAAALLSAVEELYSRSPGSIVHRMIIDCHGEFQFEAALARLGFVPTGAGASPSGRRSTVWDRLFDPARRAKEAAA